MTMKKSFTFLLLFLLIMLPMSGCIAKDNIAKYRAEELELAVIVEDSAINNAVSKFNSSSDIKIKVVKYGFEDLKNRLLDSNQPDMVYFSGLAISPLELPNYFEDITPFIKKDSDFSHESFVTKAFFKEKSSYALPIDFSINSWYCEDVAGKSGSLSAEEIKSLPDFEKFFNSQMWDRDNFLIWITRFFSSSFINLDKHESDLKNSGFLDLIDEIKLSSLQNDDIEKGYLSFIQIEKDLSMLERVSNETKGKYEFCGIPNNGKCGTAVSIEDQIGMTQNCKNKDVAWNFMRSLLNAENQSAVKHLPVVQESFDALLSEYSKSNVNSFSEKDFVKLQNLLGEITVCEWSDVEISSIIINNARYFFDEKFSADEAVEKMDEEIETYLQSK